MRSYQGRRLWFSLGFAGRYSPSFCVWYRLNDIRTSHCWPWRRSDQSCDSCVVSGSQQSFGQSGTFLANEFFMVIFFFLYGQGRTDVSEEHRWPCLGILDRILCLPEFQQTNGLAHSLGPQNHLHTHYRDPYQLLPQVLPLAHENGSRGRNPQLAQSHSLRLHRKRAERYQKSRQS